ncbi:MAG TPA: PH domain-containing protein [Candidatus Dormibacteraeota bacterium]|nr:PH domain-containing protein [Candidatus Dormibacteraeota bacterium]
MHGTKHHWMMMLVLCRIPIALAVIAVLFLVTAPIWLTYLDVYVAMPLGWPNLLTNPSVLDFRLAIACLLLGVAGVWVIGQWFRWQAMTIIITNQRFILDYLLWPRVALVIGMDRINDVSVVQTSTGAMFGYSQLKINGGGVDLHYIPHDRATAFSETIFVLAKEKPAAEPSTATVKEGGTSAAVIMDAADPGEPPPGQGDWPQQ